MSESDIQRLILAQETARQRGIDLMDAVLQSKPVAIAPVAIGAVISELLAVKRKSGVGERYLDNLKLFAGQFAQGRESLPIAAFTLADVEKFLDGKQAGSKATARARVSTVFKFGIRRGYCHLNPCDRLETVNRVQALPSVLTVSQVQAAIKWLLKNPRCLAWFVLSCFAGLRPEEADQTTWRDINFDEGWIRVEAQTTKVRQRRVVYPMAMVFEWLTLAKKLKSWLPIVRTTRFLDLKHLRKPLGLTEWPQDVTRHSAASYWLAQCGSAATVATALGHSESVMRKNYMALVTKADAALFWSLAPGKSPTQAR